MMTAFAALTVFAAASSNWPAATTEAAKSPKGAPSPAKPAPATAAIPKPKDPKATNVLIVTGDDYPGHKWKLTTPVLAKAIGKDSRLHVYVVKDPKALASPDLHA